MVVVGGRVRGIAGEIMLVGWRVCVGRGGNVLFAPDTSLTKMVVVSSCCGEDCRSSCCDCRRWSLSEEELRLELLDVRRMMCVGVWVSG